MARVTINNREINLPATAVRAIEREQLGRIKSFAESLGQDVEAFETYLDVAADPEASDDAKAHVSQSINRLVEGMLARGAYVVDGLEVLAGLHYKLIPWEHKA